MSGLNQPALVIGASPVVGGTSGQFLSVGVNGELEQSPSSAIFGIGDPVSGGTSGSVLFVDASGNLGQANTVFNWDPTNQKLGIGQINNASDHPKLLVGNGAQQIHFHVDASIGTFSEFWKDGTPTYAGAFGMQVPGNPPGNNPTLSYYNGTWTAGLTIDGTTGAVTVPNAATVQGAFTANPANANISLAPTGTGTVTINPATAGAVDNVVIGGTTAKAGTFTAVTVNTGTISQMGVAVISPGTYQPQFLLKDSVNNTAALFRLAGGGSSFFQFGGGLSGTTLSALQFGTDIIGAAANTYLEVGSNYITMKNGGNLNLLGPIRQLGGVSTSGTLGAPAVVATGRSTAQTAAVASVSSFTVGSADASFEISANALITASGTYSFTATCTYTDEGNTSRTVTLTFSQLAGTLGTTISNAAGAVPYEGVPLHIRAKASTTITIATTGTFTSVTYNIEGIIKQMA